MKKVFLSYAREDLKTAQKIFKDLTDKGVNVWLDENELLPGENWKYAIRQAISESKYFMAVLSSNSVSKIGYVQNELEIAMNILKQYPKNKIFIIPVLIDECNPADEKLHDLHWADLSSDYDAGIQKILRVLAPPERKAQQSKSEAGIPSEEEEKTAVIPKVTKAEPVTSIKPSVRLRKRPETLSKGDVKAMLKKHNFFDKDWNATGDFKNDFKDNGNGTVTDRKTGLMWQQSGSDNYMLYKDIDDYVRQLNKKGLGGYKDWRLPTIEELASLLERKKVNDRYIDPLFDKKQDWCWSADKYKGSSGLAGLAWVVYFNLGFVYRLNRSLSPYVRVVRAGQ